MIGDERWEALPAKARADRRAEGPALVAELHATRHGPPPYDPATLELPVVVGMGERSSPHLRQASQQLAEELPHAELVEVAGAQHGAHLTHAAAVADLIRRAVARG
jgi:pimeloyl-ACP methyl ester carboxylesterase